ncbi:hypothetical protein B5F17_05570 [Butyricicoccus pullicaecorum]|uniref:NEAT domain-containing protein n=1 Tax=Butyricicoccus pullicaecorum TaxID=501571 RepID=A0A1Y4L9R1_9FIRM|nr:hypothetical protein [Butyricicoccus pullicaecorum]OUP53475.1 hypothetical protein B5F17_05570 [Butyricicoccus pullicaecorum]
MTKHTIRKISAILCGVLLCAGTAQAGIYMRQKDLVAEQKKQMTCREEDYRVSLGNNGTEKEICRALINDATKVAVVFQGTGGPEKVKIRIYQSGEQSDEIVKVETLPLGDAAAVSIDRDAFDEFYITAEVTEGMGGNATFRVSWT